MKKLITIIIAIMLMMPQEGVCLRPVMTKYSIAKYMNFRNRRNLEAIYDTIKKSVVCIIRHRTMNEELYIYESGGFVIGESDKEFFILTTAHFLKGRRRQDEFLNIIQISEMKNTTLSDLPLARIRIIKRIHDPKREVSKDDLALIAVSKDFFKNPHLVQPLSIKPLKPEQITERLRLFTRYYKSGNRRRSVWLTAKRIVKKADPELLYINKKCHITYSGYPILDEDGQVVGIVVGGFRKTHKLIAIPSYYIAKFLSSINIGVNLLVGMPGKKTSAPMPDSLFRLADSINAINSAA